MSYYKSLSHVALPDASRAGDVVAVLENGPVTHAAFVRQVQSWYTTFILHPSATVALYFSDAFEFATALFGAWHAGKKVIVLADNQPPTLNRVLPLVDACAGSLPNALTPARPSEPSGPMPQQYALAPLCRMQTHLALFTSGSTGEAEKIGKRLQQLDAEVQALQAAFGHEVDCSTPPQVYSSVSHQHIYGLLFHVLWPLATGRAIMAERLNYPEEVVSRLANARNAILISSPALLTRLSDHLDWASVRSALCAVFSGGGALPLEASAHCLALMGQSPTEVLGSSETGGIAWRRAEAGNVWISFSCVKWRCHDGLLEVRSPYLDDPAQWYTTADRVMLDTTRTPPTFILEGRTDRIVKIAEKRISLTALESVLTTCPEVAAAKALSLPSGRENAATRTAAVVELTKSGWERLFTHGRRAMNEHLRSILRHHVEAVALPRRWRYVETMPVNQQGKVTQRSLQELFRPWRPEYAWQHRSELEARARLEIPKELLVFDGHFPEASLVPGVAQLHWVHLLARECFTLPDTFLGIEVLKFQQPILPEQQAELVLKWAPQKGTLAFLFQSDAGAHSSGRLVYATES